MYVKSFLSAISRILELITHFHEFEVYKQREEKTPHFAFTKKNETVLTMAPSGRRALPQKLC